MHFGEYTFHYHLWKNNILDENYNDWIGFCSYRRFWTENSNTNIKSINDLSKIIIKEKKKLGKI